MFGVWVHRMQKWCSRGEGTGNLRRDENPEVRQPVPEFREAAVAGGRNVDRLFVFAHVDGHPPVNGIELTITPDEEDAVGQNPFSVDASVHHGKRSPDDEAAVDGMRRSLL